MGIIGLAACRNRRAGIGGLGLCISPSRCLCHLWRSVSAATLGVGALGGRRVAVAERAMFKEPIARVLEGIVFIWSRPLVLGAISLDLFALLLGGATALLPVYARDILHVGPTGLGLMKSAPAVGACLVALFQARSPPDRHIGLKLFAAVGVFAIATLIFAVSVSFILSLTMLVALGASDMVSVNIRSLLVQLATPDDMRGRVSAVNMLLISASSDLGAFESGLTAALLGTVPSVVLGAAGTLLVVGIWMSAFPALRTADRLVSAGPMSRVGWPRCVSCEADGSCPGRWREQRRQRQDRGQRDSQRGVRGIGPARLAGSATVIIARGKQRRQVAPRVEDAVDDHLRRGYVVGDRDTAAEGRCAQAWPQIVPPRTAFRKHR